MAMVDQVVAPPEPAVEILGHVHGHIPDVGVVLDHLDAEAPAHVDRHAKHRAQAPGRNDDRPGGRRVRRHPAEQLAELRRRLDQLGIRLSDHDGADGHLEELRRLYEPYAISLAQYLKIDLPPWFKSDPAKDNWQTTAWQPKQTECRVAASVDEHF